MRVPTLLMSTAAALLAVHAQAAPDSRPPMWTKDDSKDDKKDSDTKKCTITSENSGNHFDLNPIHVVAPSSDDKSKKRKASKDDRTESWHARGYDYGANFTINFCGPVVEQLDTVEGMARDDHDDIGAFYKKDGKTYSIGQYNDTLFFRGRKLILTYTNGSPCEEPSHWRRSPQTQDESRRGLRLDQEERQVHDSKINDGEDDDDDGDGGRRDRDRGTSKRRKSTIVSLLCERDPGAPKAAVSFVGASPDQCSYFFEARSSAACPTINASKEQLGPSSVFGVIVLIAIIVYLVGGIVYQRAVMHQRGWRQIPNYNLWAGILYAFKSAVMRVLSVFARCRGGRKGYGRVTLDGHGTGNNSYSNGSGRGGGGRGNGVVGGLHGRTDSDDENRLIDQLDEEWDD